MERAAPIYGCEPENRRCISPLWPIGRDTLGEMSRSTPPGAIEVPDKNQSLSVDSGWSTVPPAPAQVLGTPVAAPTQDDQVPASDGNGATPSSPWEADAAAPQIEPSGPTRLLSRARADGTLLGVAPPPPAAPNAQKARSPVVVHSGVPKAEAAPLPVPTAPLASARDAATAAPNDSPDSAGPEAPPIPVARLDRRPPPIPSSEPLASEGTASPPPAPRLVGAEAAVLMDRIPALTAPVAPGALRSSRAAAPTLGGAMKSRVRFAGAEVSLLSLLAPLIGLLMVGIAVTAVVGTWRISANHRVRGASPLATASTNAQALSPPTAEQAVPNATELEAKSPESLSADEVLLLSDVRLERERRAATLFREKLERDPLLLKDKGVLTQLRKLAVDPNTAHEGLAAVAGLPGPQSADLLFEFWMTTLNRSAAELARALLLSRDVRAKASGALSVALELRLAETCDANRELLPKAGQVGDQRSIQPLNKLKRKQGCGPNKKQDCFPCLRDGDQLDAAITAAKARRAPNPFAAL